MISTKQIKKTITKKNVELKKDGMKIGVHEKDINKGHIGLGRYVTDTSRLFVQLAMKKIGLNEELLPKGFLEENEADEKGDSPAWEYSNFAGIAVSLLISAFLAKREFSKTRNKQKRRQRRFDVEEGFEMQKT